jgi:hypothetical protein
MQYQRFPSRHARPRRHGLDGDIVVFVIASLPFCKHAEAWYLCLLATLCRLQQGIHAASCWFIELNRLMPARRLVMAATHPTHAERYNGPCGSYIGTYSDLRTLSCADCLG